MDEVTVAVIDGFRFIGTHGVLLACLKYYSSPSRLDGAVARRSGTVT